MRDQCEVSVEFGWGGSYTEWLSLQDVCKAAKEWSDSRYPGNDKERGRAHAAEISLMCAVERLYVK